MTTKEIAAVFEEIAVLLELKGENPFRVRAFSNAARLLKSLEGTTESFVRQLRTTGAKGFGEQLTDFILTLYETQHLPFHEELRAEFPDGLLEFLKIPGLGAKKVKALYEQLGLTNLEQLKQACIEGKVSELKGFAKKTESKIIEEIERYEVYRTLFRYNVAKKDADSLIKYLQDSELQQQVSLLGAMRRKCEIVDKIEILISSNDGSALKAHILAYPEIHSVQEAESEELVFALKSGIPVEVSMVADTDFVNYLFELSASPEHLAEIGQATAEREIPEIADADSERAIYNSLGYCYIEPELREGRGELVRAAELFAAGEEFAPLLVDEDIRGILHAHSTYSDGANTLLDMATACRARGYKYLGISDHSKTAAYAGGLSVDDIKRQHEEIDTLNESLAPFRIFKGIESDILKDGALDYEDSVLATFDFIIVSVHSQLTLSREEMTERVCRALENPYTRILGHPTGRLLLRREPYEIDIEQVMETAAKHNVAIELNANPRRLDLDWRHLDRAKQLGIPVPICPDAHSIDGISNISYGVAVARKGGLGAADVLNSRGPDEIAKFFKR
jgi:DNA polymerase (family 10)